MKTNYYLLTTLMIFAQLSFGQNSAVTNAILYQRDGNLLKAKQSIDAACDHEKTKALPKTWYYKGLIYSDIYKSENTAVKEQSGDPLKTSTEAFQKTIQLENDPKGEYTNLSAAPLNENWSNLVNRGAAYYQSKKFQEALDMFQLAQQINPKDTTAYVYGTYAAEGLKNLDLVQEYSTKLLNMNYKNIAMYNYVISGSIIKKDYSSALEWAKKGLADFPYDHSILKLRTIAFYESGHVPDGIATLQAELKNKPYDIELLTNISSMYHFNNEFDKEMEAYTKIMAIEPYNFNANYNASVLNFEKGKEFYRKNDKVQSETHYKKALEQAKRAKTLALEDEDLVNLNKLIDELSLQLGK